MARIKNNIASQNNRHPERSRRVNEKELSTLVPTHTLEANGLPPGWELSKLGDICDTTSGGTPNRQKKEYFGGKIKWVKSGELEDSVIKKTDETITNLGLLNSSAKIFPAGTILVALYGATVGKTGILGMKAATNQAVCAVFPRQNVFDRYFLLIYFQYMRDSLVKQSFGGAQPNISQQIIRELILPVPPLQEQHRIVEKLEKLLERVERAKTSIDNLPNIIKQFRQTVLAAACSGKLVEQDPADEPASELLKRIRAERKKKWEQDLITKGKDPKKCKYEEPPEPNISELPELPSGWVWTTTEMIARDEPYSFTDGPFGSNLKTADYVTSGARVIRLQNIGIAEFKNEDKAYISGQKFNLLKKHEALPGDIIIAALADPVGRSCLLPEGIGHAIVKADCVRLRVDQRLVSNRYLMFVLNTNDHFKRAEAAAHGVGRLRANFSDIKAFVVPLPPPDEQHCIVAKVEELFTLANTIEASIKKAQANAERIKQSLLNKAFRGELVEQDPNDEPASVLLERIRAEKQKKKELTKTGIT